MSHEQTAKEQQQPQQEQKELATGITPDVSDRLTTRRSRSPPRRTDGYIVDIIAPFVAIDNPDLDKDREQHVPGEAPCGTL